MQAAFTFPESFLFYQPIPNRYNDENMRTDAAGDVIGIMFDPKMLAPTVEKLLANKDQLMPFYSDFVKNGIEQNNEFGRLVEIQTLPE